MKYLIFVLCAAVTVTQACADPSLNGTKGTPIMPSQLNSFPSRYSGQTVVVQGYASIGPESHALYESKVLLDEFRREVKSGVIFNPNAYNKFCLTIANPEAVHGLNNSSGGSVIILGRFVDSYLDPKKQIDLGACSSSAVIVDKVLE